MGKKKESGKEENRMEEKRREECGREGNRTEEMTSVTSTVVAPRALDTCHTQFTACTCDGAVCAVRVCLYAAVRRYAKRIGATLRFRALEG